MPEKGKTNFTLAQHLGAAHNPTVKAGPLYVKYEYVFELCMGTLLGCTVRELDPEVTT
jgi:hypothetical protein